MMWLRWTLSKLLHAQLNRRTYFEFMERDILLWFNGNEFTKSSLKFAKILLKQSLTTFGFSFKEFNKLKINFNIFYLKSLLLL
jgi:hypothetical protein